MSKHNKVNPGLYTQRGRLTQDDAARELVRQRQGGAPFTWPHGKQDELPHFKGSEPSVRKEEAEAPRSAKRSAKKAAPKRAAAKKAATKAPKKTVKARARKRG